MNIKYYTPTIDEFHVGFEYTKTALLEKGYNNHKLFINENLIKSNFTLDDIRVKYLDKEDIESLGWKEGLLRINNKELHVFRYGEYVITSIFKNGNIVDISLFSTLSPLLSRVFRGTIKNKSELKRLMQQLGIYE